ncbi:uncharacterized protein LOC110696701 [Chenopodium quinoa]|uniref:uncharacterized protein LOC110696701 n=1 Tax=Chenopodium quinoa TaxID=63459 RepID=UPI000B790400|nr:uncharacterized protein LOC110696701 [Chenopodium quinoa]
MASKEVVADVDYVAVKLDMHVPRLFNVWYKIKGRTWSSGKKEIVSDSDVQGLLETINKDKVVIVYCTSPELAIKDKEEAEKTNKGVDRVDEHTENTTTKKKLFSDSVKGKNKLGEEEGTSRQTGKKGKGKAKGKRKKKCKSEVDLESDFGSDSSNSDTTIEWEVGEEEGDFEEGEFQDLDDSVGKILAEVNASVKCVQDDSDKELQLPEYNLESELLRNEVAVEREFTSDSEELDSPRGSEEEQDNCPTFHPQTDFKKPIELVKGLKFQNNKILRRVLRVHAIQNRYEYWYLHNDRGRRCHFRVVARRSVNQDCWKIKSLNLKHKCFRVRRNLNLTAEFLAEKYLEDWRSDPGWKIKSFRRRVLGDTDIEITYNKDWMARARAKLLIYGSAAEQYAKVWDYGKAIIKYSPGTVCNVVVEGVDQPKPPQFLRMFICLAPMARGFLSGCRPLIGVDGCHLKGPYPGQILVAVGKDGNNNIYPIAWATVEIENTHTWVWFLESLMKALKDENQGLGFTLMSDRQKGLLEAMEQVVPYADKRYCVRHIWANFKLQFSGATFKELFWSAARAKTLFDFEVAMESIKFLSEEAYEYLAEIPAQHWSRHAFSPFPKSNMLLNNVCETFNAVIKEARDKPILTQM